MNGQHDTDRDAVNAQVREALMRLDGTDADAVGIMTGLSAEEIDDLGGLPQ